MTARNFSTSISAVGVLAMSIGLAAPWAPATAQNALGDVEFKTTCSSAGEEAFNKGLTLLHHMMYIPAEAAFLSI